MRYSLFIRIVLFPDAKCDAIVRIAKHSFIVQVCKYNINLFQQFYSESNEMEIVLLQSEAAKGDICLVNKI
jgi:hypothetical protein